ncbi:ATP-dependent protease ATPase subunit HslU [Rhynchospora pubera]|uniref:ATP-dependent protease ATPase subunit HslU n=1 Tax=Rhynchospora pubera TaxID=906938 RepID=A0AAV8FFY7_9POAL|nr:ATP-dependent protease ATPase subunit HslU [Rhynchospora pubera]
MSAAGRGGAASWRILARPLMETVLNNHAQHHRVPQPLLLHGPRGVGKTSLLLHRLLPEWNKGPHITAYVDFSPDPSTPLPWAAATPGTSQAPIPTPSLSVLSDRLDQSLENLVNHAILLGKVGSHDIFTALNKWNGLSKTLHMIAGPTTRSSTNTTVSQLSLLWSKAVLSRMHKTGSKEIDSLLTSSSKKYSMEEVAYIKETVAALALAKEILEMQKRWRHKSVRHLNHTGSFSRSLANVATSWPCLLIEILSEASEVNFFQPKLVLNNIDILRKAISVDDSTIPASVYHDSLIWRIIALGANERCLPVLMVSSDSYYSYQAFWDFGFPDIFISRETFGWTLQEARLHMVSEYFSQTEWKVIDEVLGPNPRQLSEVYALKQRASKEIDCEDIVDAYLAYLQATVVNPAMESVLDILRKFASDAHQGKIPENRMFFGAPWRQPPLAENRRSSWAKIQLMDFVQSYANTEFGVNYLADDSLEILDDPAAVAMLEVGLLYAQRDPSFIRPVTHGIQRCLVRWLVHEKMQLSLEESIAFLWQRIFRGRSYRHLMKEVGYKY